MTRIRARALLAAGALAATLAVAGAAPAIADSGDEPVNTWDGICTDVPGVAVWPDAPLGMTSVESLLLANLDGGSCTGEVNGERISSQPVQVHFEYFGSQSCGYGVLDGPARFTLGGRNFRGHATYRRAGIFVRVEITGDRGGTVVAFVRGAGRDYPDSLRALEDFATQCAGEGVREARILVVLSIAHGFRSTVPDDDA